MSLATNYARALYEAASEQGIKGDEFLNFSKQIHALNLTLENEKALRIALVGPATSPKEKAEIISDLSSKLGISKILSSFLQLLAEKGRFGILSELESSLNKVRLEAQSGVYGKVISADPLNPSDLDSLAKSFQNKLGRPVEFEVATDPTLLAGLKVVINGVTYDGTLKAQLEKLRETLTHGTAV